jgi:hypothetical protein
LKFHFKALSTRPDIYSLKKSNNAFLAPIDNAVNKMAWLNRIVEERY